MHAGCVLRGAARLAAWDVARRTALAWKSVSYKSVCIHLVKDGGQQLKDDYKARNPMCEVPTIEIDGSTLTQSVSAGRGVA